jgi:hypothetical protein
MQNPVRDELTALLRQLANGVAAATSRLISIVYDALRRQVAGYMRRNRIEHTCSPCLGLMKPM